MARKRMRETVSDVPGPNYFEQRIEAGWKLIAVEWEREEDGQEQRLQEVPFGLKIADDCLHLEDHPAEKQTMTAMLDLIVDDEIPLSQVTQELNRRGFRTRTGSEWTQRDVFNMLPRLIESAPAVFATDQWTGRKRHAGQLS